MADPNPLLYPLIAQLRAERERRGMSQEELAERAGFTEKQVAKWENGFRQPSAFLLAIWGEALGLAVVTVPLSSMQSELKRSMEDASLQRLNAIATMNSCTSNRSGKSKTSSSSRSITSALMGDLFSFLGESPAPNAAPGTRPTFATRTAAAA